MKKIEVRGQRSEVRRQIGQRPLDHSTTQPSAQDIRRDDIQRQVAFLLFLFGMVLLGLFLWMVIELTKEMPV